MSKLSQKLIFTIIFVVAVNSLEIKDAYDIECIKPFPNVARNVDYAWVRIIVILNNKVKL